MRGRSSRSWGQYDPAAEGRKGLQEVVVDVDL
jgi:hypothetical protein